MNRRVGEVRVVRGQGNRIMPAVFPWFMRQRLLQIIKLAMQTRVFKLQAPVPGVLTPTRPGFLFAPSANNSLPTPCCCSGRRVKPSPPPFLNAPLLMIGVCELTLIFKQNPFPVHKVSD